MHFTRNGTFYKKKPLGAKTVIFKNNFRDEISAWCLRLVFTSRVSMQSYRIVTGLVSSLWLDRR